MIHQTPLTITEVHDPDMDTYEVWLTDESVTNRWHARVRRCEASPRGDVHTSWLGTATEALRNQPCLVKDFDEKMPRIVLAICTGDDAKEEAEWYADKADRVGHVPQHQIEQYLATREEA